MSISIYGLNNSYMSGDMVCCSVKLSLSGTMKCFVSTPILCKVSLIKRTVFTSHSGTSVYTKTFLPSNCNKFVRDVVISELEINDVVKGKEVKFRIPPDSQSSSIKNVGSGSTRRIIYGILAKVNTSDTVIEKFTEFYNDFPLPIGIPMYFSSVLREDGSHDKRISLMYDSNTSSFTPGELVNLNVSVINKTSFRITSIKVSISHVKSDINVSCKKYTINVVPYDPLHNDSEEYQQMRSSLCGYSKNRNSFTLKMCKYPFGGDGDRIVTLKFIVSFGFNSTWSLIDTVNLE